MKKIIVILMPIALFFSCAEKYDDTAIWEEINNIKLNLDKTNQDLKALHEVVSALENNDYVSKVEENENGYTLFFSSGKSVEISNGIDGETPLISVKQDDDGKYYWIQTINDIENWVLDGNKEKIPATAEPPIIGINERYNWTIDYGDGAQEILLNGSPISAKGEKGDSMFSDVIITDEYLELILNNDYVITLPFAFEFNWGNNPDSLVFDYSSTYGIYIEVGDTSEYEVACTYPVGWSVDVIVYPGVNDAYTCLIQAPSKDALMYEEEGDVIVFVSDKKGAVYMKSVKVKLAPLYLIDLESIKWENSLSNIFHVYDKNGNVIAEICKEYINKLGCASVVVYPVDEQGKTDLNNGILAYSFVGSSCVVIDHNLNYKSGTISWDGMMPNFVAKYDAPLFKVMYKNGKLLSNEYSGSLSPVEIKPYMLNDVRGSENISYGIVKIGNQYWMRESLRTTKYGDGSSIGDGTVSDSGKSYVAFNELNGNIDSESKRKYGLLYNRYAMCAGLIDNLVYDAISPEGWHLPTSGNDNSEITILREYLGGNTWQDKIKSLEWGGTANNLSGFNLLPGGLYQNSTGFAVTNMVTSICSCSKHSNFGAYFPISFQLISDYNISGFGSDVFSYVRCIRDYE